MSAAATAVRALIVEDDPDSCDALVLALNAQGIEADCAQTVGQALVKLEGGLMPAAIIIDLRLPDASGALLLRRVFRDRLPVKVAVVTGHPDPLSIPDLVRFPPDRIFKKPVDLHALTDWIKTLP